MRIAVPGFIFVVLKFEIMDVALFKRLFYPFPHLISPYCGDIEKYIGSRIENAPFNSKEDIVKYKTQVFGHLASRFWPIASYRHLKTMALVLLFTFINDDKMDQCDDEQLAGFQKHLLATLNDEEPVIYHGDHTDLLTDIYQDLKSYHISAQWLQRFTESMRHHFIRMWEERPLRKRGIFPSPEGYLVIRDGSIGSEICFDLIELEYGIEVPEDIFRHPAVQRIRQLGGRLITLDNDMISYKKEKGDMMNMVNIIQHTENVTLLKALENVAVMRNEVLYELETVRESLSDLMVQEGQLRYYIRGIEELVLGNFLWQFLDSDRYA